MCLMNWITSFLKTQPGVGSQSARAMLNYEAMGVKKLNDSLYDFRSCEVGEENVLVIFFHGLELNDTVNTDDTYLRTWTFDDNSQECWPGKMFREDEFFRENKIVIRALATRYDPSKYRTATKGRMDLFLIAENYVHNVVHSVMSDYQSSGKRIPIVLVAHSFGGIVVRELIHHTRKTAKNEESSQNFLKNLAGIFFYATPHGALKDEVFHHIFPPKEEEHAETGATLSQYNAELIRSRERFINVNSDKYMMMSCFELYETTLGRWTGKIVEEAATRIHGKVTFIEGDHFEICKPKAGKEGFTQDRYINLQGFILAVVKAENSAARTR